MRVCGEVIPRGEAYVLFGRINVCLLRPKHTRHLIEGLGICKLLSSSRLFVWMVPLTLAVMTLRWLTCHPYAWIAYVKGLLYGEVGYEENGPLCSNATPFILMMFGLGLARYVHFEVLHVHLGNHGGMVLSWGVLLFVPTLVSMRCLVCVHDLSRLV